MRLGERRTKRLLGLFSAIVLLTFPFSAWADFNPYTPGSTMTGTLSLANGGLEAEGTWSGGASVTWTVLALDDAIRYTYVIDVSASTRDVSHTILETSDSVDLRDILVNGRTPSEFAGPKLFLDGTENPGNPGLPDDIWGVKIGGGSTVTTITFESTHVPMWGDIYAKGGSLQGGTVGYLYNTGMPALGTLTDVQRYMYNGAVAEDLSTQYLLVPDTQQVPLPGAMVLGSLGLGAAGISLKRRKKRA